jgi:hypothetical protein
MEDLREAIAHLYEVLMAWVKKVINALRPVVETWIEDGIIQAEEYANEGVG